MKPHTRFGTALSRESLFLAFLGLGSAALLLTHLTQSYLWNDEGSTALIGRTILKHGVPMQYDGENSTSAEEGRDFTASGLYKYQPWLQFYAAAASFAVLGESTFSARLPFALFGVGAILLTYFLAWEWWNDRRAAAVASLTLMLSVPFLLLAGQSRYYSMSAFFTVLGLWSYVRTLESKRYAPFILGIAAALLLHTNHGHGIALMAALALHAGIWRRDKITVVLGVLGAIGVLHLPWLYWMSSSQYGTFSIEKTLLAICAFLLNLLFFAPHPIVPIVAIALAIARWRRGSSETREGERRTRGLAVVLVVVFIPLMAAFSARPHFRYLAPLAPVGSVLAGKLLADLSRSSRAWTAIVAAVWLFTGLMPAYLIELGRDYRGPIRGIVTYLERHGRPGEMAAISYEDLPLKFYTKLRVIGGYAGDDLSLVKQAKWIIPRKYGNPQLRDYLMQEVSSGSFKKIVLDGYPDSGFENRESPSEHQFWTPKGEEPVVLYERTEP